MSSNHDFVRMKILQHLYDYEQHSPGTLGINRDDMLVFLGISENQMDFNMLYLEDKALVKLYKTLGFLWRMASITSYGTDIIENKKDFENQFPFLKVTIQEIKGDVYGQVVQAVDSEVHVTQIVDAFQSARDVTRKKTDISEESKKEIIDYLKSLEEEVLNKEPDAGKIQKIWGWLKRNADWVVPTLTQIVLTTLMGVV